jgi:hypothetical protein
MPESKRVRVIRVLEYDYPDQATAEADMARWGVPPNGVRSGWGYPDGLRGSADRRGIGTTIRSTTTFPETMPHQDEESDDRDQ